MGNVAADYTPVCCTHCAAWHLCMPQPNPFEFPYAASTSEGEKLAHKKDTRRFIPPDRVRLAPALPNIIRHRTREMSARGMKVLKDPSSYVHINLDDTKVLEESHDVRSVSACCNNASRRVCDRRRGRW